MKELNNEELFSTYGGGEWRWSEAAVAFCLLGMIGVGFYTLGTRQ